MLCAPFGTIEGWFWFVMAVDLRRLGDIFFEAIVCDKRFDTGAGADIIN